MAKEPKTPPELETEAVPENVAPISTVVLVKLTRPYWDGSVMHKTGTIMQFPSTAVAPKSAKVVNEAALPDLEPELPLVQEPTTLKEIGDKIPAEEGTTSAGAEAKK